MPEDEDAKEREAEKARGAGVLTTRRRVYLAIFVLVLVGVGIALVGKLIQSQRTDHSSYASGITKLDIETTDVSIRLVSSNGSSVEVDRKLTYVLLKPSVGTKVNGDTLVVKGSCKGPKIGKCSVGYDIAVPATVSVSVNARGGSVSVSGLKSDVEVSTTSGKVALSNTFAALHLHSTGGQITGRDLSSPSTLVKSSGKIDLTYAAAPSSVDAQTSNGPVTVVMPKGTSTAFNVIANTGNGKTTVDVKTAADSPRTVRAHSDNGDVKVTRG